MKWGDSERYTALETNELCLRQMGFLIVSHVKSSFANMRVDEMRLYQAFMYALCYLHLLIAHMQFQNI